MASSANQFSLFLLFITLLSSSLHTHARDSQLFNKVTTNNNVVPNNNKQPQINQQEEEEEEEHEPNFLPENKNGYGLYGHESGQLPPSTTTTTIPYNKHLPKNYNPVSYVTEPENMNDNNEFTEEKSFATNPTNYYYNNGEQQEQEETEFKSYRPTTTTRDNRIGNKNNFYYNGGSSFNSRPSDTRYRGGATFKNGGDVDSFQPQGMSDTRFLEKGKYFYDVNSERYSNNHPYESLKGVRARNEYGNRNYYGNSENVYEFNNGNSDVGGDEFQDVDEDNLP